MTFSFFRLPVAALALAIGTPGYAQSTEAPAGPPENVTAGGPDVAGPPVRGGLPDSVFDDTWIGIGFGVAYSPSYTGSDDYVISPLPVVQGSVGGVDIAPRPAGLALDFIKDPEEGTSFSFGPALRLRNDRADQIEDETVKLAGELDRAVEVGPSFGVSFPKLFNEFDSLTLSTDIRWDIAGAHGGMVIDPSITYFTPVDRGTVISFTLGTEYASDDFADYYFSVSPGQSAATGGVLPVFGAEGGFTRVSATTLIGIDLDGNALDGGWGAVLIGCYSRLTGDAADTRYPSIVGSKDQFFIGTGLAYTF